MATPFSIPGIPFGGAAQAAAPQISRPPASRPLSVHTAREDNTPPPTLRDRSPRASSTRGMRNRHGSLEQNTDVFGRASPRAERPTTPRRERSNDGERQSRERERRDWRQASAPTTPGDQPPGFGSRLLTVENALKETVTEVRGLKQTIDSLMGVKSTVDQLGALFENIQKAKIDLDARLDTTFAEWNTRLSSFEKTSAINGADHGHLAEAAARILKIEEEMKKLNSTTTTGPSPVIGSGVPSFNISGQFGSPLSDPHPPPDPWATFLNSRSGATTGNVFGSTMGPASTPTAAAPSAPANPWAPANAIPASTIIPPTPSSWATAGAGTNLMPWNDKHWTVDNKPPKELRTFDGSIQFYDKWRLRIQHHFIATNMFYKNIFDMIENSREPIPFRSLATASVPLLPNVNWIWLANHIYGFIGKCMNDTMLGRMATMAGGEEFNGFELWRALFVEFRGGSVEMTCNERGFFIDFPRCTKDEDLQNHIVQWKKLQMEHGVGLPDEHLRHMFRGVIPEHVVEELKKLRVTGQFPTWDLEYNYVYKEIARLNDSRLSKWNLQRLTDSIKPKTSQKINHVGTEDPPPPPPVPDMAAIQSNIERMVAAAFQKNDRGRTSDRANPSGSRSGSANSRDSSKKPRYRALPNPKFDGCWCCGAKDHSRGQCKEFKKIKDANGGKVPRDYKGAYEKHMEKSGKTIAAVAVKNETEPNDHEETLLWPLIRSPPPLPTSVSNNFSALSDSDDDDDDETDVVKALAQLTSNIQVGPKQTQSQRRKAKGLDMTRILAVAKQIRDGELRLPDVELESNDEYDCVWALVDSGAGVNCASRKQFPHAEPIHAPEVQLTTAGGETLPNRGAMKVTTTSQEGIIRERVFYDAPVDMPIISIAEVSHEGSAGSSTQFRRLDGFIEDNATHEKQHFVKRKGVYFMKIFVKKKLANEVPFGRPGLLP